MEAPPAWIGLVRLLTSPDVPDSAVQEVTWVLVRDETRVHVPRRIVEALLQDLPEQNSGMRVHAVFKWASEKTGNDVLAILGVLERLADSLEGGRELDDGRDLVAVLTAVLREADETDDPVLIAPVVTLQDRLLQFGVTELDQNARRGEPALSSAEPPAPSLESHCVRSCLNGATERR